MMRETMRDVMADTRKDRDNICKDIQDLHGYCDRTYDKAKGEWVHVGECRSTTDKKETPPDLGNLPPGQRRAYVLAGKATFTILSTKTQTRFTYRVKKAPPENQSSPDLYFVHVLTGSNNETDYSYIGIIGTGGAFRTTAKSRFTIQAPCVRAFGWFSTHLESPDVNVWHNGHCGRCGRLLTVPSSINAGIGPDCAEKG